MIQNIESGSGFGGLVSYIFGEEKDAEIICGTLQSDSARGLAREVSAIRKLNPRAKKVISHISLSLPPGESLSNEQWAEIAEKYIQRMGYENCAWIAAKHNDTAHEHIHIALVRIDMATGKVVKNSWDYRRGEAIVRELEKEYGLSSPNENKRSRRMNRNEINKTLRTGELSHRQIIAEAIDKALETPCTLEEFIDRLEVAGVGVKLNIARTGKISGISFDYDGHVFKGSSIGKSYSFSKLARNIIYEQDRLYQEVIERKNKAHSEKNRDGGGGPRGAASKRDSNCTRLEGTRTRNEVNDNKYETRATGDQDAGARHEKNAEHDSGVIKQAAKERSGSKLDDIVSDVCKWNDTLVNVGDIVSGRGEYNFQDREFNSRLTGSTVAKINAFRKQHSALRADEYRITLISRRDNLRSFNLGKKFDEEKFYTAKEVESLIALLSAKNAEGYDVYITPMSQKYHYIVLDDSNLKKIREAEREFGNAALIQETSKGNYQAVFIASKADFQNEQSLVNSFVQDMNKRFGDPNFSGVIHPFRAAGFSNKKKGRNNFFTRVFSSVHVIAQKLNDMISQARQRFAAELKREARSVKQQQPQQPGQLEIPIESSDWIEAKNKMLVIANKVFKDNVDMSVVDYRAAKELLGRGKSKRDLISEIESDIDVQSRHRNAHDYAVRTVERALLDIERAQRSDSDFENDCGTTRGPRM
jgi:hypothetical protein